MAKVGEIKFTIEGFRAEKLFENVREIVGPDGSDDFVHGVGLGIYAVFREDFLTTRQNGMAITIDFSDPVKEAFHRFARLMSD